jgi:glycosyltransferase involved in cell wall biosynthesis
LKTSQKPSLGNGEITLVVAQSPRYYPHVQRHLQSLKKVFSKVRLLYWEKDGLEAIYAFPDVEVHRLVIPFGQGGTFFFLKLMAGFFFQLRRMRPNSIEAIDPYALVPARIYTLLGGPFSRPRSITYFSMEYFSELPSLRLKPWKRLIWKKLERWGASGVSTAATVCESIAEHLREDFGIPVITVRNVPEGQGNLPKGIGDHFQGLHSRCGLEKDIPILIYQGMLQEGRGLETAVQALASLPGIHLAIIGAGPLREPLRELATTHGCASRVHFLGEIDFRDLVALTRNAFAGLAPFQALSVSYQYSLPGKLFEYIHAGVPVISTALPEIRKIVDGYQVGICLEEYSPETLVVAVRKMQNDSRLYSAYRENLSRAKIALCWEEEEAVYLSMYR